MFFFLVTTEFYKAQDFVNTYQGMISPKKLADIADDLNKYVAVFSAGRLPAVNDLMQDVNTGKILRHFIQTLNQRHLFATGQ